MASMGLSPVTLQDAPQDGADEAYEAELSRRMHARQGDIIDRFCELLADQCYRSDHNPLAEMHQLLSGPASAPILDLYDVRAYSNVGRPTDAELAKLVRFLYAEANLAVAEQVRGELSGIAF